MKQRDIATNAAVFLVSLALSLGLVEAVLRALRLVPDDVHRVSMEPRPMFRRIDGIPDRVLVPGDYRQVFFTCRGSDCRPDKWVPIHVNSAGLRDVEHAAAKPAGTVRVMVLGDSFTAADGVENRETYAKRLESLLNSRFRGRPRFETINTAAASYTTYEQVCFLRRWGLRYQPDVLVVGLYLRGPLPAWDRSWAFDQRKLALFREFRRRLHALELPADLGNIPMRTTRFSAPLHLLRWLDAIRNKWTISRNTVSWYRLAWSEANPLGLGQLETALDELARLQSQRRIPVLVLIFPKLDWLDADYPLADLHERAAELCRTRGLPSVDLLPLLRGRRPSTLWQHPSDHHPSAWVHELAASVLFQRLLEGAQFRRALRIAGR
ncbi:MAG: SGNH/GDSL hydrolase family protein [Elusimicrobia bacterium]|nr:SGNH/GDSL hydrolase family protein [Elusimicrobiota bacterium]